MYISAWKKIIDINNMGGWDYAYFDSERNEIEFWRKIIVIIYIAIEKKFHIYIL